MSAITVETINGLKERFKAARLLVIGDIIIDHFIWGSVSRISPEAPVPVVDVTKENLLLGGAANVLNNLYALGGQATLCGVIGTDWMGDQLVKLLTDLNSSADGLIRTNDRPTTKKTRIIAQSQQVVRFDREKRGPLPEPEQLEIFHFLDNTLDKVDAVIVSDYGKGMITPRLMDHLRTRIASTKRKIPIIVDPKPGQPERFKGVTILTPNNHEAELMSGISFTNENELNRAAHRLLDILECEAVLITRGEAGMTLLEKGKPLLTIPTVAKEVYDVTGAGDTVIATLALGLASGLSFVESASLANSAAGIVVGKIGTATASIKELLEVIQ